MMVFNWGIRIRWLPLSRIDVCLLKSATWLRYGSVNNLFPGGLTCTRKQNSYIYDILLLQLTSKMQISPAPCVERRPATSFQHRQSFTASPRIRSAFTRSNTYTMTRPQVSIANFYDWSDDANDGISVPKVYRQISGIPKGFTNSYNRSHVKQWCADGVYVNPGRMFIRDKAALTKGEREIIEGIYKNRGDFQRDGKQSAKGDMNFVRGHKDAWLVGKRLPRSELRQETDDVDFLRLPDYLFSKATDNVKSSTSKCYLCAKCVDECRHHKQNAFTSVDLADSGRVAPPTTPDNSPRAMRRKGKVPPIINGQGGAFVDDSCKGEGPQKKRLYVEVFLPKIPTEVPDEGTLFNFTLSREKPIISNSVASLSVEKNSQNSSDKITRTPRNNNHVLNKN